MNQSLKEEVRSVVYELTGGSPSTEGLADRARMKGRRLRQRRQAAIAATALVVIAAVVTLYAVVLHRSPAHSTKSTPLPSVTQATADR